ncbi:MAG TPA: RnfABCDGE type electron transport complex subunit B [Bacteroidales bacterium]|nr:RnfABCDGE type electron transport complex subunit B [Bacteroidales bacterium]
MTSIFLYTVLILSLLGGLLAVVLYFVARKFKIQEDPRIDQVLEVMPGANCGGCGFAGCRAFVETFINNPERTDLFCPVGGNESMQQAAQVLGREVQEQAPKIAVLRCNGSCTVRPKLNTYNGSPSCAVVADLYGGETSCSFGCLGLGDCVQACLFDALAIDPETCLPVVDEEKCTSCGACVKACPKKLIELRPKGPKNRRVYVACSNKDKGALTRKACPVGCIGCGLCVKACPFDAITLTDNLAYIDPDKCRLCRKCVAVCPTQSILEINFPQKNQDTFHE